MSWARERLFKCGGVEVVNVFALRETDSRLLQALHRAGNDPVGPENDASIIEATTAAAIVVCAWGKPAALGKRQDEVIKLVHGAGRDLYALAVNKDGSPQHPFYLA